MINFFKPPSITNAINQELENAQRSLLVAQTQVDWATSQVEYNQKRILRLKAMKNELLSSNLQSRQEQLSM